jgi:hypothetical protein
MRMELKNLIVMLMFLLVVASITSAGEIIYVDDDASVGGDGSTWDTAFKYLQDGLTITGGNANGSNAREQSGGGMYNSDDGSQVLNLVIEAEQKLSLKQFEDYLD